MRSYDSETKARVQFGKTAADYSKFRPGFPPSFFRELQRHGYARSGMRTLDIGTGAGTIARGLAEIGCDSVGLDPSLELLEEARRLSAGHVAFVPGKAEALPFDDQRFDLVAAGQCWHWFDAAVAAREVRRVLTPAGVLVLANFDWKAEPGNIPQLTLDLIPKHNPQWTPLTQPAFFQTTPTEVETPPGFQLMQEYIYEEPVLFSLDRWCGRVRASAAIGATLSPEQVLAFDCELRKTLAAHFTQNEVPIPHFVITRIYRRK